MAYNNTGIDNSGNSNSGDWNSGDWNNGSRNSGSRNSGSRNSGDWNSGNWNSGDWNSTNRESGMFCTTESTVRMFNQPTDLKWDEIDIPHSNEFSLTQWISESDMTDDEKKEDPQFFVRGGYLKTFTYHEAWANFWRDTDKANRQKFLDLPNFDAKIFEEITGIDVNMPETTETVDEVIEINGKKYKLMEEE